jgi:hypothetical protein
MPDQPEAIPEQADAPMKADCTAPKQRRPGCPKNADADEWVYDNGQWRNVYNVASRD